MTSAVSVATNHYLRLWAAPAEAAVRQNNAIEPAHVPTQGVENWRRGAQAGAKMGHTISSALLLPVDVIGGTLQGSARKDVVQLHKDLQNDTGGKLGTLPLKQRFLLRLEDGILGATYRSAVQLGALVGATVGGAIGGALSAIAWVPRIVAWGVTRAFGAFHNTPTRPVFRTPAPSPITAVCQGADVGGQVGQQLVSFAASVGIAAATFAVAMTSAGAKGVCIGVGAGVGALWGLGQDVRASWNGDFKGQTLEQLTA